MTRSAVCACVVAGLCLSTLPAAAQREVRLVDERVTIRVVDAPLREVVEQLVGLGVIDVLGLDRLVGTISADIDARTVVHVLDVLLADYNFVVALRPAAGGSAAARCVVRIHSRHGTRPVEETGPIFLSALEVALLTATDTNVELNEADTDGETETTRSEEFAIDFADRQHNGELSSETSFAKLVEHVDDDNPVVRKWVLERLEAHDSREAIAHLVSALSDSDSQVATSAVDALARRHDVESLRRVGQTLLAAADTIVRIRALAVLARRADPRSAPFVEAATKDANHIIRESASQLHTALQRRARASRSPSSSAGPPR